jgi:hypothetical protein
MPAVTPRARKSALREEIVGGSGTSVSWDIYLLLASVIGKRDCMIPDFDASAPERIVIEIAVVIS